MANDFVYGGQTILSSPIFIETILPFILVFTIVFAILQKSKILGEDKKQIDAIVALVVGLVVISFAQATGIIIQMIPFLAVSLVVILVLMIMIGSFNEGKSFDSTFPKGLRRALLAIVIVAVVIAVLYITEGWKYLYDLILVPSNSSIFINIVFIAIVIGAIIFVLRSVNPKEKVK